MQATSAETNVASIPAYLGKKVKVLTRFVKDSPIAEFIKHNLLSRGFDIEAPEISQGGPWGYRHQFNIGDMGFGMRAPIVYNDRSGEVGGTLSSSDFDLKRIFEEEGVQILHISGLIAAISSQTSQFCRDLVDIARKNNTLVSFDMNYRASFWENREEELYQTFSEIASRADILFASNDDFLNCLHFDVDEDNNLDIEKRISNYKHSVQKISSYLPNTKIFANSLRETLNANQHLWGAMLYDTHEWHIIPPRTIDILDRIGGGDGFAGGFLYGLLQGWDPEKCLQFGWASGAMAVTFTTDYAQPISESQIWRIWEGNVRIVR
jgi:2-dehydro-3-deoxygluconokinase